MSQTITVDGDEVIDATIDGEAVEEITIDGVLAWAAEVGLDGLTVTRQDGSYTASNGEHVVSNGGTITLPSPVQDGIVMVTKVETQPELSGTVDGITDPTVLGDDSAVFVSDGNEWYSVDRNQIGAIPDAEAPQKLVHRWVLADDGSGGLDVSDREGGANGINNGVSRVDGDYADGVAGDGDGSSSYIETTTLGSYGSGMDDGFAVAFSFATTDVGIPIGQRNSSDGTTLQVKSGSPFDNFSDDNIGFLIGDSNGNLEQVYNNTTVTDGDFYRAVINVNSPTASDINFWIDQTDDGSNTERSNGYGSATDFDEYLSLFARNASGSIDEYTNIVMDDICLFGSPLTSSEIQSYNNP